MTKDTIQTFTYRISKANKTEMIAILYDMGIQYLSDGLVALSQDRRDDFRLEINRARGVVKELMSSVNTGADQGLNFLSIYVFCNRELTKAFVDFDKEAVTTIRSIFEELSETYKKVSSYDKSSPVMGNTEKIYSGLTYNRSLLSNLVSDVSSNRGYLA